MIKCIIQNIKQIISNVIEFEKQINKMRCVIKDHVLISYNVRDIPKKYRIYAIKKATQLAMKGYKPKTIINKLNYYKRFGLKMEK